MQKFNTLTSIAVPLDRANIDTDAIIPKQFLKSIKRSGFGVNLFDEWRYLDHGEVGLDNSKRPLNTDFILKYSFSHQTVECHSLYFLAVLIESYCLIYQHIAGIVLGNILPILRLYDRGQYALSQ
jgi:hypothetical protein